MRVRVLMAERRHPAVEVRLRELRGWGGWRASPYLWSSWRKEGIVLCVRWVRAGDPAHAPRPPRVPLIL